MLLFRFDWNLQNNVHYGIGIFSENRIGYYEEPMDVPGYLGVLKHTTKKSNQKYY